MGYYDDQPVVTYAPNPARKPLLDDVDSWSNAASNYDRNGNYIGGDTILRGGSGANGSVRRAETATAGSRGVSSTMLYMNDSGPVGVGGLKGSSTRYSDGYWANQAAADKQYRDRMARQQGNTDVSGSSADFQQGLIRDAAIAKSQPQYINQGTAYYDPKTQSLVSKTPSVEFKTDNKGNQYQVENIDIVRNPALVDDVTKAQQLTQQKLVPPQKTGTGTDVAELEREWRALNTQKLGEENQIARLEGNLVKESDQTKKEGILRQMEPHKARVNDLDARQKSNEKTRISAVAPIGPTTPTAPNHGIQIADAGAPMPAATPAPADVNVQVAKRDLSGAREGVTTMLNYNGKQLSAKKLPNGKWLVSDGTVSHEKSYDDIKGYL